MKKVNWVWGGWLALCLGVSVGGAGEGPSGGAPDFTAALRVGRHSVSQYLVDKYFHRAFPRTGVKADGPGQREGKSQWLERFVAEQIVIAHARAQGFDQRPGVREAVDRMERHMLTSTQGPLYQALVAAEPPPVHTPEQIHALSARVLEATVVRFEDRAQAAKLLGADFHSAGTPERLRRLAEVKSEPGATHYRGPMSWPFEPFIEISDRLLVAKPGEWAFAEAGSAAYFIFHVEGMRERPLNDFESDRETLEFIIDRHRERVVQERRRRAWVAEIGLRLDVEVGRRLVENWASLLTDRDERGFGQVAESERELPTLALAAYRENGVEKVILVRDFATYYNGLFMRRMPDRWEALELMVEEMAMADKDYRESVERGLNRAPQFAEDRRGFEAYQMLAAFQQEVILPSLNFAEERVAAYYREHADEFRYVSKMRGQLLTFASEMETHRWLVARSGRGAAPPDPGEEPRTESVDVSNEMPAAGFEGFTRSILSGQPGQVFGPLPREGRFQVFVVGEPAEYAMVPFAQVRDRIRNDMLDPLLETATLELADRLVGTGEFEDRIDYAGLGTTCTERFERLHAKVGATRSAGESR